MKKKADDMLRERDLERKKSQKQEGKISAEEFVMFNIRMFVGHML